MNKKQSGLLQVILLTIIGGLCHTEAEESPLAFEGTMPRDVLERYLSRAVTHLGLCASFPSPATPSLDEDIRMITNIGAKFVGRSAFVWDLPENDNQHFEQARLAAKRVHERDPEIILQACIFEAVFPQVNRIRIPEWVFSEFGLPDQKRNFDYDRMLYEDGSRVGQWRKVGSVPDMSRLETKLWFFYRARRYIDCGMEAIHFGQVMIMDDADLGQRHWIDLLTRVRAYAQDNARRRFVLCDAHTHGEVQDGRLLFDFHSFPLRIDELEGKPQQAVLARHGAGKIYGRSKGGITPSGWSCESLPYLVEFDNWGYSGKGGQNVGGIWIWGYDEMSWFAHQSPDYRARWLGYAQGWLRHHDPNGYLQIPTRRRLAAPVRESIHMFSANEKSEVVPEGFGLETEIRRLWLPDRGVR